MRVLFQRQYLVLALLFMAKVVPTIFFMMALPVILRLEGFSLEIIGMLQLSALPYLLKFIWAPLLDRGGLSKNHYKKWTLLTGLLYGLLLLVLGTLDIHTHFKGVVILVLVISVVASTQDISISALYIKLLSFEERGAGSSSKILAVNLGSFLGSGFFLLVYNHFGWQICVSGIAALVLIALIPLRLLDEPEKSHQNNERVHWTIIFSFFKQDGMLRWMTLIVLNSLSISAVYFLLKPFLVDQGIATDTIAFMVGFYGMGVASLTSVASGCNSFQQFLLRRRTSLLAGVLLCFFAVLVFIPLAMSNGATALFYLAIACINIALTVLSVVNSTLVMDFSRKGLESADYALQMTGIHLGGLLMSAVSGLIVASIGYQLFFLSQALFSLLMVIVSAYLFRGSWVPSASSN